MLSFSVIILNWNGLHHLKTFLPSVAETDYPDLEIILADNASDDASVSWVRENFQQIKIVQLDQNYGYCGGNNRAAKTAKGDILVLLNNDVRVEKNWLQPINGLFNRYPKTAAVQPKVLSHVRPDTFEYAGAAGGLLDRLGYPWCRGRIFETLEKDEGQFDGYPHKIFWASGAAFCVRREIFEKAGGFDESFEFHMEEIDLCWRLQRMGHEIRSCPESRVWHLGGGSLETGSVRKVRYNFRNNLIMLTKNYPEGGLIPVLASRFVLDGLAGLKFLLSGDFNSCAAVARAYGEFYARLPHWLRLRGELQDGIPLISYPDGFKPLSIAFNYYIRGNKTFSGVLSNSLVILTFFSYTREDREQ